MPKGPSGPFFFAPVFSSCRLRRQKLRQRVASNPVRPHLHPPATGTTAPSEHRHASPSTCAKAPCAPAATAHSKRPGSCAIKAPFWLARDTQEPSGKTQPVHSTPPWQLAWIKRAPRGFSNGTQRMPLPRPADLANPSAPIVSHATHPSKSSHLPAKIPWPAGSANTPIEPTWRADHALHPPGRVAKNSPSHNAKREPAGKRCSNFLAPPSWRPRIEFPSSHTHHNPPSVGSTQRSASGEAGSSALRASTSNACPLASKANPGDIQRTNGAGSATSPTERERAGKRALTGACDHGPAGGASRRLPSNVDLSHGANPAGNADGPGTDPGQRAPGRINDAPSAMRRCVSLAP
jgi:hypothetical protein